MEITRRTLLGGAAAGLAGMAAGLRPGWAATEFALGDMQVMTLSDGYLTQPPGFRYTPMPQAELAAWLAGQGISPEAPITPPCNVTLVRHEGRVILFDAGSGFNFLDTVGELPDALAAAGIDPGEVTHMVFTHCHADHLWGVLDDFDEPLFYNATHMMGRAEYEYWADPDRVNNIAEDRVPMAVGALRRLEVLGDAIELFGDGEEIIPGVAARATPGHTGGHMSFELRSGSNSAMVLGDAILNEHFSTAHPEWHDGADEDKELAAQTRASLMDQLSHDKITAIGFHMGGGGIGQFEKTGAGYRFVAA